MDYVDEKRIQSAFYHPISKPKTRVGMTKIYPAAQKCTLGVVNFHSAMVDFKPKLGCVFLRFMPFNCTLQGEKLKHNTPNLSRMQWQH